MTVMRTTEIITAIEDYLARLRQARELLLDQKTEAGPKRVPRRKRKLAPGKVDPASSRSLRTKENKSQLDRSVIHLKEVSEHGEISAQVPISPTPRASDVEQPAIAQPGRAIPQNVVVKRLPEKTAKTSIRSLRNKTPKSNVASRLEKAKPAIALAGPTTAKIVVVPAEQVRREREQAAQPKVRRPRVPASGPTGRLAFEALFK
jgi:hypothetical protein